MATREQLIEDFADHKLATGEKFERLINSMKAVQEPVADPAASGTSLSFIDSISQDEDGKITATKKTLDLANAHELNPFKGWYETGDTLPTDGFDGAYLYFKDTSELTGLTTIYRWNGTAYADTGTVVDTSNVQTFETGQAVNGVAIDGTGLVNPLPNALAKAEDVKTVKDKVDGSVSYEIDTKDSTMFDSDMVYLRSNNKSGRDNDFSSIINVHIPNDLVEIEVFGYLNSATYASVAFLSSTSDIAVALYPKVYDASSTTNSGPLVITKQWITENAPTATRFFVTGKKTANFSSCYVKIKTSTQTKGLEERVGDIEGEVADIQEQISEIGTESLYNGVDCPQVTASSVADGEQMTITSYPTGSKSRGESIVFRANVSTMGRILIGKSYKTTGFGSGYSSWLEINGTNIVIYKNSSSSSGNGSAAKTIAHGLTIQQTINVLIKGLDDGSVFIKVSTVGAQFSITVGLYGGDGGNLAWLSNNSGYIRMLSDGSTLTNCKLVVSNKYIRKPLWVLGASYDVTHDTYGWANYVPADYQDFWICGVPGRDSEGAYADLQRALGLGTPKYLIWTMWGNGTASQLGEYMQMVYELCQTKGIVLVIVDRPNSTDSGVSSSYSARKAVIDTYINLGVRYWDIAAAVSSNPSSADGWYSGYLQNDGKHPTADGAKAIAMQLLADVPEIMQF